MMQREPSVGASPSSRRERPRVPQNLITDSFGLTDRGRERSSNDDQFLIAGLARALRIRQSSLDQHGAQYAEAEGQLFVVADGMGGNVGGAEASALAVGAIEDFLLNTLQWLFMLGGPANDSRILEEFKAALRRADAQVCAEAAHHPELAGMGTTLTMAYNTGPQLFIAHVGDSRCYVLRGGALHQLTRDHTLTQQMIDGGVLPPERAATFELRHIITNVVGGPNPGVTVEVHKVDLETGDVILLCTDGLTEMLSDEEICAVLKSQPEPRAACEELVRAANDRGGRDNVTTVVARCRQRSTGTRRRGSDADSQRGGVS